MISLAAGNKKFRGLIDQYAPKYILATTKFEKTRVIAAITEEVRSKSSGGGFVRKDFYSGRWHEIGDEKSRDKIGHAIRKAAQELIKKSGRKFNVSKKTQKTKKTASPKANAEPTKADSMEQYGVLGSKTTSLRALGVVNFNNYYLGNGAQFLGTHIALPPQNQLTTHSIMPGTGIPSFFGALQPLIPNLDRLSTPGANMLQHINRARAEMIDFLGGDEQIAGLSHAVPGITGLVPNRAVPSAPSVASNSGISANTLAAVMRYGMQQNIMSNVCAEPTIGIQMPPTRMPTAPTGNLLPCTPLDSAFFTGPLQSKTQLDDQTSTTAASAESSAMPEAVGSNTGFKTTAYK